MGFEVHFEDETTTQVLDADAYEQEGPLTTFFDRNGGGGLASAFALRVASFRTSRIVEIRRVQFAPAGRVVSSRWHTAGPVAAGGAVLSSMDDYPIHQTAAPIAHVASSDRNFYDRYYFNLHGS